MTQDQTSIDNAKSLINGVLNGSMLDKDSDGNVYVVGETETAEEGQ
jgi:flagellar basal body P-ring protein FlgI